MLRLCVLLAVTFLGCAAARMPLSTRPVPRPTATIAEFDEVTVDAVKTALDAAVPGSTVTLRISSYGGSIRYGLQLIQAVEDAKVEHGLRTVCLVDGPAYSMAFDLLQSGACDTRVMRLHSTLLAHRASREASGNMAALSEAARVLAALDRAFVLAAADRMGMTPEALQARIGDGPAGWIMAADEALAVHAVDAVVR